MEMEVEIISSENIKPSSPTPKHYKLSLLDELAPPCYVPILLLYPPPPDFASNKLRISLSETLARFYPLAGSFKGNNSLDCNREGALFLEAKVNVTASQFIDDPKPDMLLQLFPFDPYKPSRGPETRVTGVQVNAFTCGSFAIGVCVSHKVVDASSLCCFLQAWASTTTGIDTPLAPRFESATLFPPRGFESIKPDALIGDEKVVSRRFVFDRENLTRLKSKIANGNINPTSVEAVTALIWKALKSGKDVFSPSIITHVVNIRPRMDPPLPENSFGNLWQNAVAEYNKDMELHSVVGTLRKAIRKIDGDYVKQVQVEGLAKAIEPFEKMRQVSLEGGELFSFSSWTRVPFYKIDFGWGNPIRAFKVHMPLRNIIVLMATTSGDGIEASVNLTETDMAKFECNQELLQFVS